MEIADILVLDIVTTKSLTEALEAERILAHMAKSVGEKDEPEHYDYYVYLVRLTNLMRKGILDVMEGTKSHDDFILEINTLLERGFENVGE